MSLPEFEAVAQQADPQLDELALAVAAEFHRVDAEGALGALDMLGAQLEELGATGSAQEQAEACRVLLGQRHGFRGDRDRYDHPDNSMLDLVLARRQGLPILLSVVYVETARRAGVPLAGVGLPGHYVVAHFGADPPLLLDPFAGGRFAPELLPGARDTLRPWTNHETALRILNNLTATYAARAHFTQAARAAELRLALPVPEPVRTALQVELRSLRANFN